MATPVDVNYTANNTPAISAAWLNGISDWVNGWYGAGTGVLGASSGTSYTAATLRIAAGAAASGTNADITSFSALTEPTSHRNKIINGAFQINQRAYVSGAAIPASLYGHDRWKMATAGDTYTFATVENVTTITIPALKVLRQVVEGLNLFSGTYTLSWVGTAKGKIGAGALSASGVTGSITGGVDTTIEFGPGTVSKVQLEAGSVATPFEHRSYGDELAACQRYYETGYDQWQGYISATPYNYGSPVFYKVTKRTSPIPVFSSTNTTNFDAATSYLTNSVAGFMAYRTSTATGNGNFSDTWTAEAEL